jgi:putative hemolysin
VRVSFGSDVFPTVRREDGTWLLDGGLPVEDFRGLFDLDELPGGR